MAGRVDSCDTHVTATAAHPECLGPCRSVSRSARSEILPLQAQCQVALEPHLVAVGEPFRFGGDRAEQVDQRFHLALVLIAETMAGHAVLVSRMPGADAYSADILADVGDHAADDVVARCAAPLLHLPLPPRRSGVVGKGWS